MKGPSTNSSFSAVAASSSPLSPLFRSQGNASCLSSRDDVQLRVDDGKGSVCSNALVHQCSKEKDNSHTMNTMNALSHRHTQTTTTASSQHLTTSAIGIGPTLASSSPPISLHLPVPTLQAPHHHHPHHASSGARRRCSFGVGSTAILFILLCFAAVTLYTAGRSALSHDDGGRIGQSVVVLREGTYKGGAPWHNAARTIDRRLLVETPWVRVEDHTIAVRTPTGSTKEISGWKWVDVPDQVNVAATVSYRTFLECRQLIVAQSVESERNYVAGRTLVADGDVLPPPVPASRNKLIGQPRSTGPPLFPTPFRGESVENFELLLHPNETTESFDLDATEVFLLFIQEKYGYEGLSYAVTGGGVERGETPLEAAKRELLEELGLLKCKQWLSLGTYRNDVNRGGGSVSCFFARRCEADRVQVSRQQSERGGPNADLEQQIVVAMSLKYLEKLLVEKNAAAVKEVKWCNTLAMALLHMRVIES